MTDSIDSGADRPSLTTNGGMAARWLEPLTPYLRNLGYDFRLHFGRTYDGSFGEILTKPAERRRVRIVWIDLNSSPGHAWVKLYFTTEAEQLRTAEALKADSGGTLQCTSVTPMKSSGYASCPWMVDLRMPVTPTGSEQNHSLIEWIRKSVELAEAAASQPITSRAAT